MDSNKKPFPLATVCGIKDRIDTNPDFQRPAVWSRSQKQLLVDTILRGYDIPKMYWRKLTSNPDRYDVVDGQQRLRAIWEYQGGSYPLPKDTENVDGFAVASLKYSALPDDLRIRFDTYVLDVVVISEADEDEVREMFLRLQNGTSLKAQEKRNAMPGRMRDFVKGLVAHPFFQSCNFSNARYVHDHVAAQMTKLELTGGPCNVKNADLNRMYEEHVNFDEGCVKAKKIRRVLDFLVKAFPEKAPELERYSVISLYAIVSYLMEKYAIQERGAELAGWFIAFESYRRDQEGLSEDEADPEIVVYHEKVSHSTDAMDSIRWRHEFLLRKLLETLPNLQLKDPVRLFTHEQRMAIFRRDDGHCGVKVKCDGRKCDWDNWEADHIVPWSKGGPTTVANGQVACPECNAAKGAA